MTKNREDYIKAIFQFEEKNEVITNKILAKTLDVAPASVSQMISKLVKAELIIDKNSLKLTKEAIEIGKEIVSNHRLWEAFLLNFLGYEWQDVHDDAELLEHVTSPLLKEKLNKFLEYPKTCPHGGIIYFNQEAETQKLISLVNIDKNVKAIITRFTDDKNLLAYVREKGLKINDQIEVIDYNSNTKIYTLVKKNQKIKVTQQAANNIFIKYKA